MLANLAGSDVTGRQEGSLLSLEQHRQCKSRPPHGVINLRCVAPAIPLQGEKTARYLLERHERKYKAPMPGFEGFQHPGKAAAAGQAAEEDEGEGHGAAAGGEAGASKEQAKAQAEGRPGKPPEIVEKMVEGSVQKFLKEGTLLGQPFVKDDKQTIAQLLGGASIARFALVSIG